MSAAIASTSTFLLTQQGIAQLSVNQKYRLEDILDLNLETVTAFSKLLCLFQAKKYQIIYTLALNDLLITPSDDLVISICSMNVSGNSSALDWVKRNREILIAIDDLIVEEGTQYKITSYGISFSGKISSFYRLISSLVPKESNSSIDPFEQSFHILPNKFIGSVDRVNDPMSVRAKIRSQIEKNFILDESTIERTFHSIDQEFFSNLLKYRLKAANRKLSFRVSQQMTRTAGSMTDKRSTNEYVITIASKINEVLGDRLNSGVICQGSVDAFIVTLQHEIVHLIVHLEMDRLGLTCDEAEKNVSFKSHGPIFQNIGERFFGLTERTHRLFDGEDIESTPSVTASQLTVGSRIYFILKDSRVYGKITKLNPKRAKVELDDKRLYTVSYGALHLA